MKVKQDTLLPDVLLLPPGTDMHSHPLVVEGSLVLQVGAGAACGVALPRLIDCVHLNAVPERPRALHLSSACFGTPACYYCSYTASSLLRLSSPSGQQHHNSAAPPAPRTSSPTAHPHAEPRQLHAGARAAATARLGVRGLLRRARE